jgi:hypothetical protein
MPITSRTARAQSNFSNYLALHPIIRAIIVNNFDRNDLLLKMNLVTQSIRFSITMFVLNTNCPISLSTIQSESLPIVYEIIRIAESIKEKNKIVTNWRK